MASATRRIIRRDSSAPRSSSCGSDSACVITGLQEPRVLTEDLSDRGRRVGRLLGGRGALAGQRPSIRSSVARTSAMPRSYTAANRPARPSTRA